jgi:hypothetical protein
MRVLPCDTSTVWWIRYYGNNAQRSPYIDWRCGSPHNQKHDGRKKRKTHIYLSRVGVMESIVHVMVAGLKEEGRWTNWWLQCSERRWDGPTDSCRAQRGGEMVQLMVAVLREEGRWSNWWLQCSERRWDGPTDGYSAQRGGEMVQPMVQCSERRWDGPTDGCSAQRGGEMVQPMVAVLREEVRWSTWWLQCSERRGDGPTDGCSA